MLKEGQKMPLGKEAVAVAEARLGELIGKAGTKIPTGVKIEAKPTPVAPIVKFSMGEGFTQKKTNATAPIETSFSETAVGVTASTRL